MSHEQRIAEHPNAPVEPAGPAPVHRYPAEVEQHCELSDGARVFLRPLKPTDGGALKTFFTALDDRSLFSRFFAPRVLLTPELMAPIKDLDYHRHFAVGGFVGEQGGEELIGVANWVHDSTAQMAHVAFIVRDDWQNRGLGTRLAQVLSEAALARGLHGFKADVLKDNQPVLRILEASGYTIRTKLDDDAYRVVVQLDEEASAAAGEAAQVPTLGFGEADCVGKRVRRKKSSI